MQRLAHSKQPVNGNYNDHLDDYLFIRSQDT